MWAEWRKLEKISEGGRGSLSSVTSKKLPNVDKSCPKMISLEKLKILTTLQNLPTNVGDLGKLIVATGFEKLPQIPINRPIWSHWLQGKK